jgi:hypothetical protein
MVLRPSPSELLTGVADALESTVLDELERGTGRNQVVAAIGIVRRCAAAIDRHGPLLHADVTDLADSLAAVVDADPALASASASASGASRAEAALTAARAVLGRSYPSVSELIEVDLQLREVAAALGVEAEQRGSSQVAALRALFERMVAREGELGLSPW